jgi:hypothetical protein
LGQRTVSPAQPGWSDGGNSTATGQSDLDLGSELLHDRENFLKDPDLADRVVVV